MEIVNIDIIVPTPQPVTVEVIDESLVEVEVQSLLVGPQGPAGPQGAQGIQGIQGVQGIQGPQGPAGSSASSLNYVIDNGSTQITTGIKGFVEWPFNATILGWTILANEVGSIVVDIWKDTYGNFAPTISDSITGSEKPSISSGQKNQDLTLNSFQVNVLSGDIWAFVVESVSIIKKVTIAFRFNKT